jgi:arginase
MAKDITIIINPSEITAGTRGASLGPFALMQVARTRENQFFGNHTLQLLPDFNYLLDSKTVYPFAKRIDGLINVFEETSSAISSAYKTGNFPVVLAGDHGSAGGTIAGIRASFPDKRLGVVWIDAHGDLHSPYTTPSGNMHGMPLSTALGFDNEACKSNDIDAETREKWNQLKELHGICPKILPEDLVFIAVRDTEHQEDYLIEHHNIKNYSVEEVRRKGIEKMISEINDKLTPCDLIYISFDVDSMDPHITSHGTGTPVDNGLTPEEALEIMSLLVRNEKTCCLEFVEINPCLDEKTNKMAETAFELLEPLVSIIKHEKK